MSDFGGSKIFDKTLHRMNETIQMSGQGGIGGGSKIQFFSDVFYK